MRVTVTEAKGQLTDLVRRAERGEEVVLTRHGQAAVKLVPAAAASQATAASRGDIIKAIRASAAKKKRKKGPSAARSQDFLYDKDGLPK